jgi:hypothetical protein
MEDSKLVESFSQALALRRRDKGKPAARRGRKAYGPALLGEPVAGLPNGGGVISSPVELHPLGEKGVGHIRDDRGCAPFNVTDNDTDDLYPAYSPSGKTIAYVGYPPSSQEYDRTKRCTR